MKQESLEMFLKCCLTTTITISSFSGITTNTHMSQGVNLH